MNALFRSFVDSLLVLLIVPMASVGGLLALHGMNLLSGILTTYRVTHQVSP